MKLRPLKSISYLLLSAGALAMVFPFVWMLSTSFKSSLEVLSARITLVPELKKYIRINGHLEQVEFSLALKFKRAVTEAEGKLNILLQETGDSGDSARREISGCFSAYQNGIQKILIRYEPKIDLEKKIEKLWRKTIGPISASPSVEVCPPKIRKLLARELKSLHRSVKELVDQNVFQKDKLKVVILAGEKRGGEYTIPGQELIEKRFLWENFKTAWRAAPFARYFLNSIFISIAVTIGQVMTSALAAYAFARMQFRFKEALFLILLGTMMVPKQVILIPDYVIIAKLGWINTYYALIVPFVAAVFGIYFMRQHFETIPQDLFDAASIDGCGRLRTLFQIVLPLSRSVLVTVSLFTFIMTWNSLLWPLVMTNTPEMRPLQVGLAVFNQESGTDWELLMAASTFSILPLLVVFFIAQKQFIEGITRSGIKG